MAEIPPSSTSSYVVPVRMLKSVTNDSARGSTFFAGGVELSGFSWGAAQLPATAVSTSRMDGRLGIHSTASGLESVQVRLVVFLHSPFHLLGGRFGHTLVVNDLAQGGEILAVDL